MNTASQMVIVYEDEKTRAEALKFSDKFVKRFWSNCKFELSWVSFAELEKQPFFKAMAQKAVSANLIVFSLQPGDEMPFTATAWIESWVNMRGEREGSMIGLQEPHQNLAGKMSHKHIYLRAVAHRAGMDYLTQCPDQITDAFPDSMDSVSHRACEVTSVLDQILHKKITPTVIPLS